MKFDHYLKEIERSSEFKDFQKKNKKAYLCAGFFVLDFEAGKHMRQVDYALPNGKIATFIIDNGVKMKISDQTIKKKLPEIKGNIKTDLEALKGIVEDEMKNRTVTENIKKMIAILHILDNKVVWNLQCILNGLGILNVHVDDSDQSILKFEKHSLMEFMHTSALGQTPQLEEGQEKKPNKQEEELIQELQQKIKEAAEKAKKEPKVKAKSEVKKELKVKK